MNDYSDNFADFPWPNSIRITESGELDMDGFKPSRAHPLLSNIVTKGASTTNGFGTNSAVYFKFSSGIDRASLPATPAESTLVASSVYLMNIDEDSDDTGQLVPIETDFKTFQTLYRDGNLLSILPAQGYSLDEDTTYAAIIFNNMLDMRGNPIEPSPTLTMLDEGSNINFMSNEQRNSLSQQWNLVKNAVLTYGGRTVDEIAGFTVFHTQTVSSTLELLKDSIDNFSDNEIADSIQDIRMVRGCPGFAEFHGSTALPIWQIGEKPYLLSGGSISITDDMSSASVQSYENVNFSLVIGCESANDDGRRVVVKADGTGARHDSAKKIPNHFFPRDSFNHVSISLTPLHSRERSDEYLNGLTNILRPLGIDVSNTHLYGLLFYNYLNPPAAVGNQQQSASEQVWAKRIAENTGLIAARFPNVFGSANLPDDAFNIKQTDAVIAGQSQGAGLIPLTLAMDSSFTGAYMNGAASHAYPQALHRGIVRRLLNSLLVGILPDELDKFHPLLQVLQTFHEPADGTNFTESSNVRDLLITSGFHDGCVVREGARALAESYRLAGKLLEYDPYLVSPTNFPIETDNVHSGLGIFAELDVGHYGDGARPLVSSFLARITNTFPEQPIVAASVVNRYNQCDSRWD